MTVDVTHQTLVKVLDGGKFLLLHRDGALALLPAHGFKLLSSKVVLFSEQSQHDLFRFSLGNVLSFGGRGRPPTSGVFPGLVLMLKFELSFTQFVLKLLHGCAKFKNLLFVVRERF